MEIIRLLFWHVAFTTGSLKQLKKLLLQQRLRLPNIKHTQSSEKYRQS
jgi:hypothetical protein